jgi:hypothetical protein
MPSRARNASPPMTRSAKRSRRSGKRKLPDIFPDGTFPSARRLINQSEFAEGLEDGEANIELVETVLTDSIRLAYEGQIDFDDQIYMPTLFGGTFPRFPLVMVDEAQDLSPLNHAMLEKLVTSRLIAVGDPFQSIYGFRGAIQWDGCPPQPPQHDGDDPQHLLPLPPRHRPPRAVPRPPHELARLGRGRSHS